MASQSSSTGELRAGLRDDAGNIGEAAKNRIHRELDSRKGAAVDQVKTLSSALESAADEAGGGQSEWLRSTFEQGAQALQRFARSVEQKDSRQLSSDVQQLARTNPATFLGICTLAGFAAARVIKAGGQNGGRTGNTPSADFATSDEPTTPYTPAAPYTPAPTFGGTTGVGGTSPTGSTPSLAGGVI